MIDKKLFHGDFRLENILLKNNTWVIGDIGLGKKISYYDKTPLPVLKTMRYLYATSPELFYYN